MTSAAGRRLAKLEGALPPREAVLAWLAEARRSPGLVAHARSIVELSVEAAPLSVIGARVEAATREALKGQPRDAVESAVLRAVGDAVFLFALVIGLNGQALEIARLEGLRAAAVFFWMGALLGGPVVDEHPEPDSDVRGRNAAWVQWRRIVDALSVTVRVETEARAALERRYFGGQEILLADAAEAWAELVEMVERLGTLAETIIPAGRPTTGHRRSGGLDSTETIEERMAERVAWLADDARVRAYDILGDRPCAVRILERRLRS